MMDGGQRADGASASGGRLPIIIVCSTSDLEVADAAAGGLRTRGYDVALLGAAEEGPIRLVEIADRFDRQGLYVLCRGGELDRDAVERLRSTLRSMDVPFGRTLTLATGQGGARGLEERIVSVARRMVTGRYDRAVSPLEDSADGDGVFVTGNDIDRWADSLAGGQIQPPEPSGPVELPTAVVGAPPIGGPRPTNPAPSPGPGTGPGVAPAVDDYEPVDKTLVTRHPIPGIAQREESSAPSPASMSDDDISASAFSSGPNMRWIAAGGVVLVLIIALVIAFSGDDPEPAADTVAAVEEARDEESEPEDAEPEDAEPEDAEPEDAEPEDPTEASDEPSPAPEPEAQDDGGELAEPVAAEESPPAPTVDEQLADLDLEGAQKSLAHRSMVDVALLDDRPLPPSAPKDRAAIAQALADREIRSWNAFLLAGEDAPEMTFSDAETFCKTLVAGDISGWRLPSIGELLSLSEAKMLEKRGIYWSETPGDAFGDTRIVVNVRKGSTAPVRTDWDGAKPICIRVRE